MAELQIKPPTSIYQTANASAMFLVASAITTGLGRYIADLHGSVFLDFYNHPEIPLMAFFILLFRLKTTLDDLKHFHDEEQFKNGYRQVGFGLAILSWVIWAIAGYSVASTTHAAEVMLGSILVSTAWIVVHLLEIANEQVFSVRLAVRSLRQEWIGFNILYMLLLGTHWLLATWGWHLRSIAALTVLILALIFDVRRSQSFRDLPH